MFGAPALNSEGFILPTKDFDTEHRPVLEELLHRRMTLLGLTKSELVRRWGYSNVAKGLRRLHQIEEECYRPNEDILAGLAKALQLSVDELQAAIDLTRRYKDSKANAVRSAAFKPHGYLMGTRSQPSQITFFAMTGGWDRWCRIVFDTSRSPITYIQQALPVLRAAPCIPFLGETKGVIINFTLQRAVIFDVAGNPIGVLTEAYVPGSVNLQIGGREVRAPVSGIRLGFGA